MAREKTTITVDRAKLDEARALLNASSASAAVDVALSEAIRRHRVLNDVRAYFATPPTDEAAAPDLAATDWRGLADDTDWDSEWPESH